MPTSMTTPMSDMISGVVPVSRRATIAPANPGGTAIKMMNEINKRSELGHKDQVKKDDRKTEAGTEALEKSFSSPARCLAEIWSSLRALWSRI